MSRQVSRKKKDVSVRVVRPAGSMLWLCALLMVMVGASAVAGVYVSHLCRGQYRLTQHLETQVWNAKVEYGRMLLEQSVLAPPHRVEKVAIEKLGMQKPDLFSTRLVRP